MSYTVAQAAQLTGCTASQVRHWSRSALVVPSEPDAGYGFRDLVSLRVVRTLLDAGLPSARVRLALNALREFGDTDLAGLRLITDGRTVWSCHDDGQILDALRHGQLALFVAIDRVAEDVESEVRAFQAERAAFVDGLVHPAPPASPSSARTSTAR